MLRLSYKYKLATTDEKIYENNFFSQITTKNNNLLLKK